MYSPRQRLRIGATNLVRTTGLQDITDASYPTDAAGTATLLDAAGQPVAGATNLPVARVGSTTGAATLYQAVIPSTVALVEGSYTLRITLTSASSNAVYAEDIPCIAAHA